MIKPTWPPHADGEGDEVPADDVDNVLTEWRRQRRQHGAAHVRQSVNQLPLQEGNQRTEGVEKRPSKVIESLRGHELHQVDEVEQRGVESLVVEWRVERHAVGVVLLVAHHEEWLSGHVLEHVQQGGGEPLQGVGQLDAARGIPARTALGRTLYRYFGE